MEQCCGILAVEIVPGKQESTVISAPILARERELSLAHAQMCTLLIMEQYCVPLAVEYFHESTAISVPILTREREIILAHAQRCIFLIMEQCCGPLTVDVVPGEHCDFNTYLTKRARTHSGAFAEVQFPDY
jgi:hypothetical protein